MKIYLITPDVVLSHSQLQNITNYISVLESTKVDTVYLPTRYRITAEDQKALREADLVYVMKSINIDSDGNTINFDDNIPADFTLAQSWGKKLVYV